MVMAMRLWPADAARTRQGTGVVGDAVAEDDDAVDAAGLEVPLDLGEPGREAAGEVGGAVGPHGADAGAHVGEARRGEHGRGQQHLGAGVVGDEREAVPLRERVDQLEGRGAGLLNRGALHPSRGVDHQREVDGGAARDLAGPGAEVEADRDLARLLGADEAVVGEGLGSTNPPRGAGRGRRACGARRAGQSVSGKGGSGRPTPVP